MNVMAGKPDGATREEMRGHLNQDGGACGGSPPVPPPPGSVHSGMGDRSASEEGDVRGAQGDNDTGHMGTGGGWQY